MSTKKLSTIIAMGMLLAACGGPDTVPVTAPTSGGPGGPITGNSGASTTAADDGQRGQFLPFDGALPGDAELLEDLVIYFEFDSSEVRSDFNEMLAAHGRYLAADPTASVRLEGHADERGTREYNIGIGERRAQAIRQILLLQGASATQLSTVSYGEERPAAFGSDEESYALNRRVELVYR